MPALLLTVCRRCAKYASARSGLYWHEMWNSPQTVLSYLNDMVAIVVHVEDGMYLHEVPFYQCTLSVGKRIKVLRNIALECCTPRMLGL